MLKPSLQEFAEAIENDRLVPLRRRVPADLETPVSVFLKLSSNLPPGERARFLLESVEQGIQVGRYSFIGVSPSATIDLSDGVVTISRKGETSSHPLEGRDPLSFVRDEIERTPPLTGFDLPGPFAGAVGYISYEVARYFENLPEPAAVGLGLPEYSFMIPRSLIVFDHVNCEMEIVVLPEVGAAEETYRSAEAELNALVKAINSPLQLNSNDRPQPLAAEPESNMTRQNYEEMVGKAKEHILAGDAFQIVLSQRLGAATNTHPFQVYRALRILNPSPYMFFFDHGSFQLIGSSPEVLVKLEKGKATLAPIAGTRPRGHNPREDDELAEELLADEKERAEHIMLVDLGRNDLGRVCETGTVATESLMHIERYSHVMHIVSTVTGRLREGLDAFDLVRAAFPAGTVSGAPKIRAMEIISQLETDSRGPYAGALGYFGRNGDMDMCITIRTIVMKDHKFYVQAGAGIVADSNPASEFEETLSKIRALTRAIAIAEEGF